MRRLVPLLALCAALAACTHGAAPSPAAADTVDPSGGVSPPASAVDSPASSPTAAAPTSPSPSPRATSAAPKPTTASNTSVAQQLLAQVNQLRAASGLRPYTMAAGLVASAHQHNLVMSGGCGLNHQCPGEADLGARVSAQGVRWHSCGENIGESGSAANTQAAILAAAKNLTTSMYNEKAPNDGHRKNLLSTGFTQIGIDVIRDAHGTVWLTQDFAG